MKNNKWEVFLIIGVLISYGQSVFAMDCDLGDKYYAQAVAAGQESDFDTAERHLEKSVSLCNQYKTWHLLGRSKLALNKYNAALDAFEQAQSLADSDNQRANSLARYAEVLSLNSREAEALSIIQVARNMHDSSPEWMMNLAKILDQKLSQKPMTKDIITRSLGSYKPTFKLTNYTPSINIRINFEFNSTVVDHESFSNLDLLASVLDDDAYDGRDIKLVGHTDVRGDEAFNDTLSLQRAIAVRDHLLKKSPGLASRLIVVGAGENEPLYPGTTEEDHRLNRRLQVYLE